MTTADRASEAYAARTASGRLVLAHLGPNLISPLHRALRTAHLAPENDQPPGHVDNNQKEK